MNRRTLLILCAGMAVARPHTARAQQKTMPVVGFLGATSASALGSSFTGFHRGLGEAGFVDGRNLAIEYRWAEGHYDRLPGMAADLVTRQPSVIVAATAPAALAAKAATGTIPIVFFSGGDPVEQGLVESFGRPGGNLTGACVFINALGPKRLELLRELAPKTAVIGFLVNPDSPNADYQSKGMQAAAPGDCRIVILGARTAADIDAAFAALAEQHGDGLVVGADPFFGSRLKQIAALAMRYRVPVVSNNGEFVEAGGLIGYGNDVGDAYRQVGNYTGRVLKGAKLADPPILRATKFELSINLKTAKTLGLTVPPLLSAQADEVIE